MKILFDKNPFQKTIIDNLTGFLHAPVTLSRVGIQKYLGSELGLIDRANDVINVIRKAEDVFDQKSIDSFVNLII